MAVRRNLLFSLFILNYGVFPFGIVAGFEDFGVIDTDIASGAFGGFENFGV